MNSAQRLLRFKRQFSAWGVDAFFVSCDVNVSYLSGYTGTESYLFITPKKSYLLTDFRYVEQAQKEARGFEIVLRDTLSYVAIVNRLCQKHHTSRLGVEGQRVSRMLYEDLSKTLKGTRLAPQRDAVEKLRVCKAPVEIKKIKKAIEISALGVRSLQASLAPGMREREIQARLEYETKMLGSQKPAFDIIIAADPKSSMPHAVTGEEAVKERDMLLVDMGVVYEGYHCDLTR